MARERKWLTEYVAKEQAKSIAQDSRESLLAYAAGEVPVGYASTALRYLASLRGASGCLAVLSGDDSGFADIDRACLESYWVIRLLTRGYHLDQDPDKQARATMERVATCWMHAEAIGAAALRTWLDSLVKSVDAGDGCVLGKAMNPLCTLVAHFATGRDVAALERSGWAAIGIYASVAARTPSVDYDALAAFHQDNVEGKGYPPFHAYPGRIAPFELLAIARRTGIAIEGRHPLLTSPLARPRSVPEILPTAELQAVVASGAAEVGPELESHEPGALR